MRALSRIVVAVGLVLGLAAPGAAEPIQDALVALSRRDYPTALNLLQQLAAQGNAVAQNNLGSMYDIGRGVRQDYAQAIVWYRKAAEHGSADDQYNLGVEYARGHGVNQDFAQAVVWFLKAAEHGSADAQYNLGAAYARGQGVPQDFVRSYMWLNLAASQGNADAANARDLIAAGMVPQQIADAEKLASDWLAAHPRRP